ncbi:hypothetical protein, partial [Candidatus Acidianus copahuensis]|uniref:hypothetical protein n=1 Tax=Candidatus Acidianus copahuensis TaxID=1160895 RepID=UPI00064EBCC3
WVVCGGVSLTSPKIQTGELYINATHVEYGIYQGGWHEETGFYGPLNISLEGNYTYSNSHNNEGYFSVIDYIAIINVVYENGKSVTIMSIGPIEHKRFPQISINIDHGSRGYYNQLTWIATVEGTEKISVEPTLIDAKFNWCYIETTIEIDFKSPINIDYVRVTMQGHANSYTSFGGAVEWAGNFEASEVNLTAIAESNGLYCSVSFTNKITVQLGVSDGGYVLYDGGYLNFSISNFEYQGGPIPSAPSIYLSDWS